MSTSLSFFGLFTPSSRKSRSSRRRPRRKLDLTPQCEQLEIKIAPATFAASGTTLDLVLGTSEKVAIVSSTTSYTLSLGTDQTWIGTDSADVTGNGLQSLTITSTGITDFSTGINITDSGSTGGDAVAFNDSTTNPYANNLIIALSQSSSGASTPGLSFTGASTFSGTSALTASVNGDVVVNSGASLALNGGALSLMATGTNAPLTVSGNVSNANGPITLQATGDVTVGSGVSVNSGTAALNLAADVQADGSGDDGVGTLSVGAGANLYGASIALRGADVNIDSTANVGSASSQSPVSTFVPASAGLSEPIGMAFDSSGNLYVANYEESTISEVTPGGAVSLFASGGGLDGPTGMAFDASGNLYVANWNDSTISKVTPGGAVSTFVSSSEGLAEPFGLAFDSSGNLYVANEGTNTINKVTPNGTVSTFANSTNGLSDPTGLAFDASGNLFVSSRDNDTISKVTPGGTVSTFVSSGLNNPWGIAFDASGNLDVANFYGNTVSQVTPDGTVSTLIDATEGLSDPAGLAFDSSGALYISNLGNNTISKVAAALPATTQVTIRSSLPSRPMSLGGSNNAAVNGINLTSAELARIVTAPTGTVTIGDSTQTGDITFSGATVATTAGAATTVVQSTTGAGQIVLDDSNGTALDGNGGSISLTAGTGGIAALNPANATAEIATTGASVTLNTTGPIGTASNPIQFADNTNTAQQVVAVDAASSAHLDGLGSLTLGSVTGGTSNTALTVTARTDLVVAANATINTGTATLSLGEDVNADGSGNDGVETLSIDAGASLYGASITLRGADIDIDSTANVGSASAQSPIPATTQVTIQSSLPTRPMSLGGTNNDAVDGINLTSAELARIFTTSTGTVTVGDPTQTGDITFSGATVATTAGAATTVVQSNTGAGQIVLDASNGIALDGNGGTVTLTPGTGGLSASVPDVGALLATNGFTAAGLTLNLALNAAPTPGQNITLVSDTGSPIDGNFTNLANGSLVTFSYNDTPYQFLVSYKGGAGNDLVLTAVASPTITSADSTTFTVGQAGSFTITTTGLPTAAITETGSLPAGVTLTDNANGTATLAGTPQAGTGGAYSLTFTAANGVSPNATQSFTLTVNQASTTTTLTSGTNSSVSGQSVTFTATVAAVSPGSGTPTGTVNFLDNGTTIGADETLNSSGVATFSTSSLAVGTQSITAVYSGDTTFATSTSSAVSQVVDQASTTTALASGTNPSVSGQSVTFTATVAAVSPGSGTPTGTVNFDDNGTQIGTGTLTAGVATFTTSSLTVGTQSITAVYSGDTSFTTSTSSVVSQVVNQASTTTALALTSGTNPSTSGQSVTFTATVAAVSPGSGTPTGTVTFDDNGTQIGTGTLTAGVATFSTSSLAVGTQSITAVYSGDTNFATSTSSAVSQVVNQATPSIGDPGFEQPAVATGAFEYDPTGSPWVFTGSSGISGNNSGFTSGNPPAPQGVQVAFLQGTGSFSQSVTGWAAGSYVLTFDAAQRGNFGVSQQNLEVLIDGSVVGTFKPSSTSYQGYSTASFTVTAGTHTIEFQGLDSAGGDNTAFLDQVAVAPSIGDPGFEQPAVATGAFEYDPTGSPWVFTGSSGISGNNSGFTSGNPPAPQGVQVAFLQGTGSFTQSVTGWAAGSYVLTFDAAQRGNFGVSQQNFEVLIDGRGVDTFTPSSTSYQGYSTVAFTVTAGAHTITFQGLDSAGGDNTALLDQAAVAPSIGDPGFEQPAVATGAFRVRPHRLTMGLHRRLGHLRQQQRLHLGQSFRTPGGPGRLPPGNRLVHPVGHRLGSRVLRAHLRRRPARQLRGVEAKP